LGGMTFMTGDLKNRPEWESRLETFTKEHEGAWLTVEVVGREYGAEEEVERLPFSAIGYDPRDDVVIVTIGGLTASHPVALRHMVWHPVEVDVADDVTPPAIRLVEKDGTTTVVTFLPPAPLVAGERA
jgi:Family of unknown function (DUF5335)